MIGYSGNGWKQNKKKTLKQKSDEQVSTTI